MNLPSAPNDALAELQALAGVLRPELHRYCARLMGSVVEGEDVVQDTFVRAFAALHQRAAAAPALPPLRPWIFRIAHNRALDLLRGRALRRSESIDDAAEIADAAQPDPAEALMRRDAVRTAVSRFAELPIPQRSVVVLKDVLGESLAEIAALLELSVDAVKAHLARGRARLREIDAAPRPSPVARPASAAVANYAALFDRRDWDGLRALLADDVRLVQSAHPPRSGRSDVGLFFTIYARHDTVRLVPGWLEGREVIAVFEPPAAATPTSLMWLEWRAGRVVFIRDYRHVGYVVTDAEWTAAAS